MEMINNYNENEIKEMIKLFENHKKIKEYRKNYYRNKYQNDASYRNRKILSNKKYLRSMKIEEDKSS